MRIELRLVLYTSNGYPAGPHLGRTSSLPVKQFNFSLSEMERAEAAREALQGYCDKNSLQVREK